MKNICFILMICLLFSCQKKQQVNSGDYPVIYLNPDQADDTLRISDYFKSIRGIYLKNCTDYKIGKIIGYQSFNGKHILLAAAGEADRLLQFSKDGDFECMLDQVGRGPGEHLQYICNPLQMDNDGNIHVLDNLKHLTYSENGEFVHEEYLYPNNVRVPGGGSPDYLLNDSLIVLIKSENIRTLSKSMIKFVKSGLDTTHCVKLYSLKTHKVVNSFFPQHRHSNWIVSNGKYVHRDTLCFFYDKESAIYQLFSDRKEIRYRIDRGKYEGWCTLDEYIERGGNGNPSYMVVTNLCETDQHVWGNYYVNKKHYAFIYDKYTGQTKNFGYVNHDLLGVNLKSGMRYFQWLNGFQFNPRMPYFCFSIKDWITLMNNVKEHLGQEEWEEYCRVHPEFIRYYEDAKLELEDETMWTGGKTMILVYEFK